jgi:hypothetical protein
MCVKTYYRWSDKLEIANSHIKQNMSCEEEIFCLKNMINTPLSIEKHIDYKNKINFWEQESNWQLEMAHKLTSNVPNWFKNKWEENRWE